MIGRVATLGKPYDPKPVKAEDAEAASDLLNLNPAKQALPEPEAVLSGTQDGLQLFLNTRPPFMGRRGQGPSALFIRTLLRALEQVPRTLRQKVSDWGYKVITATRIPDLLPGRLQEFNPEKVLGKRIPNTGQEKEYLTSCVLARNWWSTSPSVRSDYPKTIFMPEVATLPKMTLEPTPNDPETLEVQQVVLNPKRSRCPKHTMLHEFGHAVDDFSGHVPLKPEHRGFRLSATKLFAAAYAADLARIQSPAVKEGFAYFLPRPYDLRDTSCKARGEAFAEAFANLLLPIKNGELPPETEASRQLFIRHFPNTCQFVSSEVLQPYQGVDASAGVDFIDNHQREQTPTAILLPLKRKRDEPSESVATTR